MRKQLGGMALSFSLLELLEAYDEACVALDNFRRDGNSLADEYETVCAELEADIAREAAR
jgi:hypothetical protein